MYIPHPATWLNAKGWEDEVIDAGQANGSKRSMFDLSTQNYQSGEL
jgi:hypothetical protein